MISDEPDEDADTQDDEGLLETFIDSDVGEADPEDRGAKKRASVAIIASGFEDWPGSDLRDSASGRDAEMLSWFKTNHANSRLAMAAVLRGWTGAKRFLSP
jgi:hypothetical protein